MRNHQVTDSTKVIFVQPPQKVIWRGWLKCAEAREYAAGISKNTLAKWREDGLQAVKRGGEWYYKPQWIDAYLQHEVIDEAKALAEELTRDF